MGILSTADQVGPWALGWDTWICLRNQQKPISSHIFIIYTCYIYIYLHRFVRAEELGCDTCHMSHSMIGLMGFNVPNFLTLAARAAAWRLAVKPTWREWLEPHALADKRKVTYAFHWAGESGPILNKWWPIGGQQTVQEGNSSTKHVHRLAYYLARQASVSCSSKCLISLESESPGNVGDAYETFPKNETKTS